MNDQPDPPPPSSKPPFDVRQFLPAQLKLPPVTNLQSALELLRTHNRTLQYVGAALIVLAFPLTWWSLSRYRVYEQRGVDLGSVEQTAAIEKNMNEDDKKAYQERIGSYGRAWTLNIGRYEDFYYDHLGDDYAKRMNDEIAYSMRSATLGMRGWSTWTGWFGVTFVAMLLATYLLPHYSEDYELIAWAFPLAAAGVFAFFTVMALIFFLGVPGDNGDGYAQGVGLGNYVAILGSLLVTVGATFEGIKSMNDRLAALAEAGDDEEPEEDAEAPTKESPAKPKKHRLDDW